MRDRKDGASINSWVAGNAADRIRWTTGARVNVCSSVLQAALSPWCFFCRLSLLVGVVSMPRTEANIERSASHTVCPLFPNLFRERI